MKRTFSGWRPYSVGIAPLRRLLRVGLVGCILVNVPGIASGQWGRGGGMSHTVLPPITDSKGFKWDLYTPYGHINQGQNNCFSGAAQLRINNQQFQGQSSGPTAGGLELTAQLAGLEVTRRIKVDVKRATIRYVESLKNNGGSAISVALMIHTQLGTQCQAVVDSEGNPNPTQLVKKSKGIIAVQQAGQQRPSVLLFLGNGKKLQPLITIQNNQTIICTYNVSVPAGKEVAILHGLAQRSFYAAPTKREAAKLFAPFVARTWTKDLSSAIRATVLNSSGGSSSHESSLLSIEELVGRERGSSDVLYLGEGTRLRGAISCAALTVAGRYGDITIPFEHVAALVGAKSVGRRSSVYLRNGQVVVGQVTAKELVFTLNTGLTLALDLASVDLVTTRSEASDGRPPKQAWLFIETFGGDRLAVLKGGDSVMSIITPWGERRINMDEILSIESVADEIVGYRAKLKDGSNFFGLFAEAQIQFLTQGFGTQTFSVQEIKSIVALGQRDANGHALGDVSQHPHVVLVGENVVAGAVDADAIRFAVLGESIPVPPPQIKILELFDDEETNPRFTVELWDGDLIAGAFEADALAFRFGDDRMMIPSTDIVSLSMPAPAVPESLRSEILELIRALGNPDWKQREAASARLSELGIMARGQLAEALMQTRDTEVKERVKTLLNDIGE